MAGRVKKWKTNKSANAFKTDWFSIRRDDCLTGDGKRIKDFYAIDTPDGAVVVPITKDGKIVLVKQYRQSIGKITLECPAGFVDRGEKSFAVSARRELLEETGYKAKKMKSMGTLYSYPAKLTAKFRIFLALDCEKVAEQSTDEGESIGVVKIDFKKAVEMVKKGNINSCDSGIAIFLAEKELKLIPTPN